MPVIKLTEVMSNHVTRKVLIGTESIITVKPNSNTILKDFKDYTKIESRAAMVTSTIVKESVEEINDIISFL